MTLADYTTQIFFVVAWINVVSLAALAVGLIAWTTKPAFWPKLKKHLQEYSGLYAGIVALFSTAGSLWLSEISNITPCVLCWYQRIMMYPLVIVLGFGHFKKLKVKAIGLTMAIIGAIIAAYHYGVQRIGFMAKTIPCSVDASCSQAYLGYWGFYSIPLMALTGFILIIACLAIRKE